MRPDFVSVFYTPSVNSRSCEGCVAKGRKLDYDDMPASEGMAAGRRRGWNRVEHASRLFSSVDRLLRSRSGRPWNDVWSEVCAVADDRNGPASEFRDYVLGCVDVIRWTDARGRMHGKPFRTLTDGPYVDCEGILRYEDNGKFCRRGVRNHRDPDCIVIDDYRELRKVDGNWFEVRFGPYLPRSGEPATEAFGIAARVEREVRRSVSKYRNGVVNDVRVSFAISRRSLSGKELRDRKLSNDMHKMEQPVGVDVKSPAW